MDIGALRVKKYIDEGFLSAYVDLVHRITALRK